MPLHQTCLHCGRSLVLDEAFAGAICRCKYCRHAMQVPASSHSTHNDRPKRPSFPAFANKSANRVSAGSTSAGRSSTVKSSVSLHAVRRRWLSPARIGGMAAGIALVVSVPVWRLTAAPGVESASTPPLLALVESGPAEPSPLVTHDPLREYFGLALSGYTIGYVVDGDSAMAPYIDKVAYLTNSVNARLRQAGTRFGIAMAVQSEGKTYVEVLEPWSDLEGARTLLTSRLPVGQTDLNKALAATSNWYPDQVFMVLAKPVAPADLPAIRQNAERTGGVVNVIALGAAAKQEGLADVAVATGGRFVPVQDSQLDELVELQRQAEEEEARLAAPPVPVS